jgi:uncharacterized membrane protein
MALMLPLILAMSALAIDYGMVKSARAEAQRAVDAAALAGAAAFLPDDLEESSGVPDAGGVTDLATSVAPSGAVMPESATAWAREYARQNTVRRTPVELTHVGVDPLNQRVTATYTSPGLPLWFANIFATGSVSVTAKAIAQVASGDTVVRLVE